MGGAFVDKIVYSSITQLHRAQGDILTGKCIRRFAGIYSYSWYFIEQMW